MTVYLQPIAGLECSLMLPAGKSSDLVQKTSGADVRAVMDGLVTENRFQALSAPRSSAQPAPGALKSHAKHDQQSVLCKHRWHNSLWAHQQSAEAPDLPAPV